MAPVLAAFIVWLLATGKAKDWVSLVVNLKYSPEASKSGDSSSTEKQGKDWTEMGIDAWKLYRTSQTETNTGKTSTDPEADAFKVSGTEA